MAVQPRSHALGAFAIVFALLALSDVLKPLRLEGADTGLVVLGRRLTGSAGAIAGLVAGSYLAALAVGIWRGRRWAVPMAWVYVLHVTANVLLFPFRTPQPPDAGIGYWAFGVVYTILAIGGATACAVLVGRRRAALV